jgi:TIGR03009 family protein
MPQARAYVSSLVVSVLVGGGALAFSQDPGNEGAAAPRRGGGAPAVRTQAPLDPARMDWLLRSWERQSAKLRSLDVRIYRIDSTPAWNEEVHYAGRAVFQSPELAYLDFKKIKTAPNAKGQVAAVIDPKTKQRVVEPHETIICSGKEVWQYLHDVKQIFVYPLDKAQRKRALDEGPLPFLFNMKANEAKARYGMRLKREDPKFFWVEVEPKLPEDRERFRTAWVFLDPEYLLPLRIVLFAPDNKSSKDFRLSDIRPNREVDKKYFTGGSLRGWKLIRDPKAQQNPGGVAGVAVPQQVVPRR